MLSPKVMKKWIAMLIVGVLLVLGPVWGLVGTVLGMTQAFGRLAQGAPQPEDLASDISLSLYSTAAGYIVWPIGVVLVVVAAIKISKCKKQQAPQVGAE